MKLHLGIIDHTKLLALVLLMAKPITVIADTNSMANDAVRTFWSECQHEKNLATASDVLRVRHFGQDSRVADLLVGLIASGNKTGTFTSPWLYAGKPNETPVVGGYTVVTSFLAEPRLLLRTTAIKTMRFDEIGAAETRVDGPAVRALEVWQRVHWAYFGRELAKLNRTPSQDMPVTVEEFEVVCVNETS